MLKRTIKQMFNLFRPNTLKGKSTRGAAIMAIATVFERIFRLVRNMILARLLAPEDFGLMGMIMAILTTVEFSTDVGIQQVLIQDKNGGEQSFMNITWWFQLVRRSTLFFIAQMASPWICEFYEKPEMLGLLRCALLVIFISGFTNPRLYRLEKDFKYIRSAILIQGGTFIGNVISIILGLYFQNAWVLVIGRVGEGLIRCVLSYVLCPFRPGLQFNREYAKSIVSFSKGMLGLPILTAIVMQADIFVMGKVMPTELVGMYVLAMALAMQANAFFGRVVNRVLFAAFSHKQDEKERIRFALRTVIRNKILISVPFLIFAGYFSGPILRVVYGDQYSTVAEVFAILCWLVFIRIQVNILALVYLSIGRPHLHRRLTFLLALCICGLIYPGIKWLGLSGAALALLISNIVTCFFQVWGLRREIGLTLRDYITEWKPGVILLPISLLFFHIFSYYRWKYEIVQLAVGAIVAAGIVGAYYLSRISHKNTYKMSEI